MAVLDDAISIYNAVINYLYDIDILNNGGQFGTYLIIIGVMGAFITMITFAHPGKK